ncbi:MAG: DUF1801 domain-containing protein [Rhizobiales bacterium]|nr:DUF1801 domain-containing protein [Hyphomicrobiales bacterium]
MSIADTAFEETTKPYPKPVRRKLAELRKLVLSTARDTPGVGRIEEGLRWNQHSFLTSETGSGSTIRIDGIRNDARKCAIYFHCQSGLVEQFKELYDGELTFEGKRSIILDVSEKLPADALRHCISLALTHHLRKRNRRA